jgi:hypothetical protein
MGGLMAASHSFLRARFATGVYWTGLIVMKIPEQRLIVPLQKASAASHYKFWR